MKFRLPDELKAEALRRAQTPLEFWKHVESLDEIAATARDHVDDLALAERISFQDIDTGGHGTLYEIFVDGEPAEHFMRMSGPPADADKRIYAARLLRQNGLVLPHGEHWHGWTSLELTSVWVTIYSRDRARLNVKGGRWNCQRSKPIFRFVERAGETAHHGPIAGSEG